MFVYWIFSFFWQMQAVAVPWGNLACVHAMTMTWRKSDLPLHTLLLQVVLKLIKKKKAHDETTRRPTKEISKPVGCWGPFVTPFGEAYFHVNLQLFILIFPKPTTTWIHEVTYAITWYFFCGFPAVEAIYWGYLALRAEKLRLPFDTPEA